MLGDDELGLGDDGELGGGLVVGGALGAAGGEDIPCVLPWIVVEEDCHVAYV